jgi:hypothetical protein
MVAATLFAAREQSQERVHQLTDQRLEVERALADSKQAAQQLMAGENGASATVSTRMTELASQMEQKELALRALSREIEALSPRISEAEMIEALGSLDPMWQELFPAEQERIVRLLVSRVDVRADGLEVQLRADGLEILALELQSSSAAEVLV